MRWMIVGLLVTSVGCTVVTPDPGTEAVLVKKPVFFGTGGIDPTPLPTGRHYAALTTSPIYVDMKPFTKTERYDDMMSADGVPLDFEAEIRLRVVDSVALVRNFGEDWYRLNLQSEFQRQVRDAVKKRGMNEVAITATASTEIDQEVTDALSKFIDNAKLPVDLVNVTLGRANPPDAIKDQRIETAAQEQRANTEKFRKLAEDQRYDAEQARAASDNAYRQQMQLSPNQFLQLEQIKMLHDVCAGGKCTFILGDGAVPTLSVK